MGVQPSERFFPRDIFVPFSSTMRAQATCVALLWTVGEQGRVLQGQGVFHKAQLSSCEGILSARKLLPRGPGQ